MVVAELMRSKLPSAMIMCVLLVLWNTQLHHTEDTLLNWDRLFLGPLSTQLF